MSLASPTELQARPRSIFRVGHLTQSIRSFATVAPLVLIDAIMLTLAITTAHLLLRLAMPEIQYSLYRQLLPLLAIASIAFPISRAYAVCGLHPSKEFREIVNANVVAFITLLVANMMMGDSTTQYETTLILISLGIALLAHPIVRVGWRAMLGRCGWWGWPVVVVGDSEHQQAVFNYLINNPMLAMRPVALISARTFAGDYSKEERHRSATYLINTHKANHVVLAVQESEPDAMRNAIELWEMHVNNLIVVLKTPSLPTLWTETQDYGGMLGLHARAKLLSPGR